MKDRRGFLKLLGIGAGAVAAGVLAVVAGQNTPPPRTIQDIEKGPKPYIGPDGLPGGDYIKKRPPVIPVPLKPPELTDDQYQWIVDGQKVVTFVAPPPFVFGKGDIDISGWNDMKPGDLVPVSQTTGGSQYKMTTTCDVKS